MVRAGSLPALCCPPGRSLHGTKTQRPARCMHHPGAHMPRSVCCSPSHSVYSGLLPLEERVGHTPAVARALRSVTQLHRAERYHLGGEGGGPEDRDAPTMQQRAASADPGSGARPPRPPGSAGASGVALLPPPAGLAPIRTSASPEQPPLQQQAAGPGGEAAAAAGRGARGSRAQRTGAQSPSASPAPAAAGGGAGRGAARGSRAARTGAPPAGTAGRTAAAGGDEAAAAAAGGLLRFEQDGSQAGEEAADVEVTCLSQAWNVFESVMRQVPATQVRQACMACI